MSHPPYYNVFIDHGSRIESVCSPNDTRSDIVRRVSSGEYGRRSIDRIHYVDDYRAIDVTDDLLAEAGVYVETEPIAADIQAHLEQEYRLNQKTLTKDARDLTCSALAEARSSLSYIIGPLHTAFYAWHQLNADDLSRYIASAKDDAEKLLAAINAAKTALDAEELGRSRAINAVSEPVADRSAA